MDKILYFIIVIGLCIFMCFYGGHNFQNKIEYDSNYFNTLNRIIFFEKKLQKITNQINFDNNFVNINNYVELSNSLIPNFVNCFFIKILPFSVFNITNIIDHDKLKTHIMIIFNHNKHNNLELILDNNNNNNNNNIQNQNIGFFYDLDKMISITGIYHIYNNSDQNIIITLFICKKPFWHY